MPESMPVLLDEIDALLADGSAAADQQVVVRLERTLTDGYASALALEGERIRIEREIEALTAELDGGDPGHRAEELAVLARRRASIDGDLRHLRDRLALLRRRARELRAASQ